jgi:diguanylate cyclase (GGDEF)-like protein/PAS domain S-box-containing protein
MKEIPHDILLDSIFDGVYYVDLDKRISYWNKAAERITGYAMDEVLGSCCSDNILMHVDRCGNEMCKHNCPLQSTLQDGQMRECCMLVHHKKGHRLPVHIRITPVRDDIGLVVGAVEIFTDNSNVVVMQDELDQLKQDVYLDPLTGVANRRFGEVAVDSRMHEWQGNGTPFGILFLDVDHFKAVNDNYGHNVGDEVLVMVATSVANVLRKLDVVARWGGEEFVAVLPGANHATLCSMAERIRVMVEQSFVMIDNRKLGVTVSIGGTMAFDNDCAASIVARADEQMYQSKKDGRNRATIYDGECADR